jgi:hypothetical protein
VRAECPRLPGPDRRASTRGGSLRNWP